MIPDCTLVTACFDLTKYNNKCRNMEEFIVSISALLHVPCYLVIYTDTILIDHIHKIRDAAGLTSLTKYYVTDDVATIDSFKYVDIVKKNREKYHPTRDERTCAESHLVCCNKFDFVLKTIEMDPFHTTKFGWIDANIGVNFKKICTNYKNNMLLDILTHTDPTKFSLQVLNVCNKKYILEENLREYYSKYQWLVCGCLFIAGKEVGIEILTDLKNTFIRHTMLGYGHGEEMFYLEILDKYYDKIHRSYGDYPFILNNFIRVTDGVHGIYHYMANNYLSHRYYREGNDCCDAVLTQYENFQMEMNYEHYFNFLFVKYVCLFYLDKEKAREHRDKIVQYVEKNPYLRKEFLKNKDFYDTQFSLI